MPHHAFSFNSFAHFLQYRLNLATYETDVFLLPSSSDALWML